ncbi:MAG: restriction endonuclease, SacI family [Nitrososphaerota archaeon]
MSIHQREAEHDPVIDPESAKRLLEQRWQEIASIPEDSVRQYNAVEDEELRGTICRLINSKTKSFRYAILTQVLAKAVEPSINCLTLQVKARIKGSFDARSLARDVVFPFDMDKLNGILGASEDPYVSKPLRHDEISPKYKREIRDKRGWDDLHRLLSEIEKKNNVQFTLNILDQILLEIRRAMFGRLEFPFPPAAKMMTLTQLIEIIEEFLSKPSGGIRLQVVIYSLLKTVNDVYRLFGDVRSERVNVANAFARRFADIECFSHDGRLNLAIAVTERLGLSKLQNELTKSIQKGIRKLIITAVKIEKNHEAVNLLRRYSTSIDVCIISPRPLIHFFMMLLDEDKRNEFLKETDRVLKEFAYYEHREEWVKLLTRFSSEAARFYGFTNL